MKQASPTPSTMWTQVIEVIQNGDPSAAARALEAFCRSYHPVIVSFFGQRGCTPEDAEDYAQEFFSSSILDPLEARKSLIHRADRQRNGRFRPYLFQALRNFYVEKLRQRLRQRTGGAAQHVTVEDQELSEDGEAARRMERRFDRTLALEVIQRAASQATRSRQFLACLRGEMSQREAAQQLDLTEGAFKVAYHRFRRDFPQKLRDEVAKLVVETDPAAVEEEIRYLMDLFSREDV